MILSDPSILEDKTFSVIIIGSGPAGISTALELDKYNIETLIIEAGSRKFNDEQESFFNGYLNNSEFPDLNSKRTRAFGGTSYRWGGYCNRFEKEELENWPLTHDELHKHENECNKILGLKNYHTDFYIREFSNELNQYHMRFASNLKFEEHYYEEIKNSKNISLSLETMFMEFRGSKNNVTSIKCKKDNKTFEIKSKYFVLACGGIENSRLLLWSQKKNPNLFNKNLQIGKKYMDHSARRGAAEGFLNYKKLINYFKKLNIERDYYIDCLPRLYLSPNAVFIEQKNILNTGVYIRVQNSKHNNPNINKFLRKAYCISPNFFKTVLEEDKKNEIYKFKVRLHPEQEPDLNNTVKLSDKLDPIGIPLPKISWRTSDQMKLSNKISLISLGNFLVQNDIGRLAIDEKIFDINKFKFKFNGNHQIGGTCMGNDVNNSVVDKNLKVHFVNNLYISGSSTFPTSGHNHPTYTIVLLSLRLANHLKNKKNI